MRQKRTEMIGHPGQGPVGLTFRQFSPDSPKSPGFKDDDMVRLCLWDLHKVNASIDTGC